MPRAPTFRPMHAANRPHVGLKLLILRHRSRRIFVPRPVTYEEALDVAKKHFPAIPRDEIILQTDELEECCDHFVDITPEVWSDVVFLISSVMVSEVNDLQFTVTITAPSIMNDQTLKCKVKGSLKGSRLFKAAADWSHLPEPSFTLTYYQDDGDEYLAEADLLECLRAHPVIRMNRRTTAL